MRRRSFAGLVAALCTTAAFAAPVPETQRLMLTGHGPDDAVPWDFRIDGGMQAGKAAKIAVPSNWQQKGFGHYQYGYDLGPRADGDHGSYSRRIAIPADWKGRVIRIVFDGVMTDALVKVNGAVAGPVHQGGFNRFGYDVTALVKPGEEALIEVEVSEVSAAKDTELAERHADYWAFSGIYRPAWLEAAPAQSIGTVAIDARADGDIAATIGIAVPQGGRVDGQTVTRIEGQVVTLDGSPVGQPFSTAIPAGGSGRVRVAGHIADPKLWSAEAPNLYALDLTLYNGETAVHRTRQRFGFRTFEVRPEGLFLNGQRILLKGVNRHSFRADTGRALSRADSYADARELKALNMNAVRMSHYSPEESFLEAADELGLYVLDELSGWQHAHDTEVGRKLVRELVERDVNHPAILFWDNGNEGGWNRQLDGDFALYDPQQRTVLHPWEWHGGIDTKHYPHYEDLVRRLSGPALVMPTEFLHGLYDGGGGAGVDEYWRAISTSPRGAGGFIWAFADEGIARTDQAGRIDVAATLAPDGIVGARHEWEPSAYAVRDVWSPVQIAAPRIDAGFAGLIPVTNLHDFTSLDRVRFEYAWIRFAGPNDRATTPRTIAAGAFAGPPVAPHANGALRVPLSPGWAKADALSMVAKEGGTVLAQWTWPVAKPDEAEPSGRGATPHVARAGNVVSLTAGGAIARFDAATGLLTSLSRGGHDVSLRNGPRLVAMTAGKAGDKPDWTGTSPAGTGVFRLSSPVFADQAEIDIGLKGQDSWGGFKAEISGDGVTWRTIFSGDRTERDGMIYGFPAQTVSMVRVTDLHAVHRTPEIVSVRLGAEPGRFPLAAKAAILSSGEGSDPATGRATAWIEARNAGGLDSARWTMRPDGTLTLDYAYSLSGQYLYHGIGFDQPPAGVRSVRALAQGPRPVWKNRTRGTVLGVYDLAGSDPKSALHPDDAGYFAGLRWARFETAGGLWTVRTEDAETFLQLGAKVADSPATSPAFPASDVGFLKAIPPIGTKFQPANTTGPAGLPSDASGRYAGRLTFQLQ
ncbi:glycoside hydrolase family 2 TIM barrel-domain containing protein [Sphingomonas sp. BIUV-7]|uniref:beta-galactosidase n=1 Tax=Sphingomonas natans TaxID=3063330 RepID=A0ABT8YBD2_9SPHN|nr:glycoside hydrolase family 2 TIM barrel-domain containing protein [Sphingomonas sp. BIUV-7]MDO6415019.1 glycoside hydrolase family 2 TIM barrel-domain containing protein [Sphingomonas sp. BIUV-7]